MNFNYIYIDFVRCNYNPIKWLARRIEGLKNGKVDLYTDVKIIGDVVKTVDGTLFDIKSCDLDILHQVNTEYKYDDIRPDDIVMDIGANVGMFSLKVKDMVEHIYAVEPLYFEELNKNIRLNHCWQKVHIFTYGLGVENIEVSFGSKRAHIQCRTLSDMFELIPLSVTFLKIDCEGGEWCIKPEELKGIRRIEAEIHNFDGKNPQDFVDMLKGCGFDVLSEVQSDGMTMVHAYKK